MDYDRGLEALRRGLPAEEQEALDLLEYRLRENLELEERYGGSDAVRAERGPIVQGLNRLARAHLQRSFVKLCDPSIRDDYAPNLAQLRPPAPDFVGRRAELARLVAALEQSGEAGADGGRGPATIIRGMGGIGKSELAYAAADRVRARYPNAQLLIELRGTTEHPMTAAEAMKTVIHALEPQRAAPEDERQLRQAYLRVLRERRVLILADDARDATQFEGLVPPAGSALIVTTRHRLIPGFTGVDLQKLDDESAQALLLAICPRIGVHAARLAQRCGNHALALRVSASQLAHDDFLRVEQYLRQLEDEHTRIKRLKDPTSAYLDVDASLELSYKALKPPARQALCQLSIFAASFDHAALEAVVKPTGKVDLMDVLSELRHHSLLEWDEGAERYDLHDLVRAFGAARRKDEHNLWLRYGQHYLKVAEQSDSLHDQGGVSILAALALFDRERPHLDAVWRWLQLEQPGITTDQLLAAYHHATNYAGTLRYHTRNEHIPQLETVLHMTQRRNMKIAEGHVLADLGNMYSKLGDTSKSESYYQATLNIAHNTQTTPLTRRAFSGLGHVYESQGDPHKALIYHEQALTISRQLFSKRGESISLSGIGSNYQDLGDFSRAIECYEEALAIDQELGNTNEESTTLANLAFLYEEMGHIEKAIELCLQSIAIKHELGAHRFLGPILVTLSLCYNGLNQPDQALRKLQQALDLAHEEENPSVKAYALGAQAVSYTKLHQLPEALAAFREALTIFSELGDKPGEVAAYWRMGEALAELGQIEDAVGLMQRRVDYRREIGHLQAEADAARVAELRGRGKRAEDLDGGSAGAA